LADAARALRDRFEPNGRNGRRDALTFIVTVGSIPIFDSYFLISTTPDNRARDRDLINIASFQLAEKGIHRTRSTPAIYLFLPVHASLTPLSLMAFPNS
jgi:hypothetical protein